MTLARALMDRRDRGRAWRLQNLTPLDVLADFDDTKPGFPYGFVEQSGAPIEPDGTPVYYRIPESFLKAKNDGERWRWALAQATDTDPGLLNSTRCALASFLLSQFGTPAAQGPPATSGLNALDTLTDDETVAQLASGIKRFKLPDEFNPIKVYQSIASDPQTGHGEEALDSLVTIFENRGQLDRAADYLKQSRNVYGEKDDRSKTKQLDQILGAWGEFVGARPQTAGRGASVDLVFRNGTSRPLRGTRNPVRQTFERRQGLYLVAPSDFDHESETGRTGKGRRRGPPAGASPSFQHTGSRIALCADGR